MEHFASLKTACRHQPIKVFHTGLDILAWCIAFFFSVVEILCKGTMLLFKYSVRLALQLTFVLLLAAVFLLAYAAVMGISMAFGPAVNSQLP